MNCKGKAGFMNNRTLTFLTVLVLVGIGAILLLNIASLFKKPENEKHISLNDVRGVEIQYKKKLYPLSLEQQVQAIQILNDSLPVSFKTGQRNLATPNFEQIIIYQMNKPDVVVTPVGYDQEDLVFRAPSWNEQALLKEFSDGNLKKIIQSAIEP